MVAQLIRQDDGSYDYVEVGTVPLPKVPPLSIPGEFEAYEGVQKKDELVSAPSLTEQTEKIQRELPGQVEFDARTGQFITKKPEAKYLEYKKPEITPESTEITATEKVMKMAEATRVQPPDYSKIMKDAMAARVEAIKPTIAGQLIQAGKDIAISYVTRDILSKTFAGRLATSGMMQGGMVNPYAAAGMALMRTGVGEDIGKVAGKAVKAVTSVAKSVWKSVTGGSVICSELYRQNLISKEDYKIHWDYTMNKWTKDELKGYWVWAMPTAKKMKTNKWLTKFWLHIMKYKIQYVKYTLGKAKFTLKGYIYNSLVEQISLLTSKFIVNKKPKEVLV